MGTIPFTLRLDDSLKQSLEAEAKIEDRSASYLATRAIKNMLDAKAAKRRMIDEAMTEADKGIFISEEKLMAWFQSLGTDHELPEPEPDIFPKSA